MAMQSAASLMVALFCMGVLFPAMADARQVSSGLAMSSKWDVKTDQPASIGITNAINGVDVTAHCHSPQQDASLTTISSGTTYTINFADDLSVNIPWTCEFGLVGENSAVFTAWTHDGTPYLSACDECSWKVQTDGFYILNSADDIFYKMYSWS